MPSFGSLQDMEDNMQIDCTHHENASMSPNIGNASQANGVDRNLHIHPDRMVRMHDTSQDVRSSSQHSSRDRQGQPGAETRYLAHSSALHQDHHHSPPFERSERSEQPPSQAGNQLFHNQLSRRIISFSSHNRRRRDHYSPDHHSLRPSSTRKPEAQLVVAMADLDVRSDDREERRDRGRYNRDNRGGNNKRRRDGELESWIVLPRTFFPDREQMKMTITTPLVTIVGEPNVAAVMTALATALVTVLAMANVVADTKNRRFQSSVA